MRLCRRLVWQAPNVGLTEAKDSWAQNFLLRHLDYKFLPASWREPDLLQSSGSVILKKPYSFSWSLAAIITLRLITLVQVHLGIHHTPFMTFRVLENLVSTAHLSCWSPPPCAWPHWSHFLHHGSIFSSSALFFLLLHSGLHHQANSITYSCFRSHCQHHLLRKTFLDHATEGSRTPSQHHPILFLRSSYCSQNHELSYLFNCLLNLRSVRADTCLAY